MGKIKKVIINGFVNVLHFIFSLKTLLNFKNRFNLIYSYWILKNFKEAKNLSIKFPLYLNGGKYIKIGNNFDCDQRLRLDAIDSFLGEKFTPEIIIGENVSIQMDCHIGAINKIIIGDGVLLASKVYISDHSHGEVNLEAIQTIPAHRKLHSKGPVIIENNVWIGEGVTILPGVTIGENSIIGANSVVTKSIARNCVAAGNPARIIREIK